MIDETGQALEAIKKQTLDLLQFAVGKTDKNDKEVAVTLVINERSHELNLECHDTDRPTDIISLEYKSESSLSFSGEDLEENPKPAEMLDELDACIGELPISVDKARERAEEYGHSFKREMGSFAVHDSLHTNGYDHYTPEEKKEMSTLQEEILTAYGFKRQ